MIDELGWSSLENRRIELRLILLFKVVHGLTAVPHEGHIQEHRTTARSNSLKIREQKWNINNFRYSFFPRTIIDWNALSDQDVLAPDISSFKLRIHKRFD